MAAELKYADKYVCLKEICGGPFSTIWLGKDELKGDKVAIKLSDPDRESAEKEMYGKLTGAVGILEFRWAGIEAHHSVLVTEVVGPSILDLFFLCERKFSLKTVLLLADQMVQRVEYVHSKSVIHRDIKPSHFLIGTGSLMGGQVFLVDYSLAKSFIDPETNEHIKPSEVTGHLGSPAFRSTGGDNEQEQSRRSDLESLAYVLIYLLRGELPWMGAKTDAKLRDRKLNTPIEVLCKGLPAEFQSFLKYAKNLSFAEDPDYGFVRKMFRDLFVREGFRYDGKYDWLVKGVYDPSSPIEEMMILKQRLCEQRSRRAEDGEVVLRKRRNSFMNLLSQKSKEKLLRRKSSEKCQAINLGDRRSSGSNSPGSSPQTSPTRKSSGSTSSRDKYVSPRDSKKSSPRSDKSASPRRQLSGSPSTKRKDSLDKSSEPRRQKSGSMKVVTYKDDD